MTRPASPAQAIMRTLRSGLSLPPSSDITPLLPLARQALAREPGPTVALTDAGVFLLDGACTYGEPTFFSVNDKLYLTYDATVSCCGCGDRHFFVYDLSSGTPKMVYRNSKFAD